MYKCRAVILFSCSVLHFIALLCLFLNAFRHRRYCGIASGFICFFAFESVLIANLLHYNLFGILIEREKFDLFFATTPKKKRFIVSISMQHSYVFRVERCQFNYSEITSQCDATNHKIVRAFCAEYNENSEQKQSNSCECCPWAIIELKNTLLINHLLFVDSLSILHQKWRLFTTFS